MLQREATSGIRRKALPDRRDVTTIGSELGLFVISIFTFLIRLHERTYVLGLNVETALSSSKNGVKIAGSPFGTRHPLSAEP